MVINYIKNLWYGNISLYIVFWVYYFLIGMIIYELFPLDEATHISFLLIMQILFHLFLDKVLWTTANNYKGKYTWRFLSKLIVILDLLSILILLPIRIFSPDIFIKIMNYLGIA